jgi:hypothetical protein
MSAVPLEELQGLEEVEGFFSAFQWEDLRQFREIYLRLEEEDRLLEKKHHRYQEVRCIFVSENLSLFFFC